jgi:hypothetical protein
MRHRLICVGVGLTIHSAYDPRRDRYKCDRPDIKGVVLSTILPFPCPPFDDTLCVLIGSNNLIARRAHPFTRHSSVVPPCRKAFMDIFHSSLIIPHQDTFIHGAKR